MLMVMLTINASMLLRYLADKEELSEIALLAADTNGDDDVSNMDLSVILQYIKKMPSILSA